MPTVAATVMCNGCAFSGVAAARIVAMWAGGRDGPPRLFGCRTVMIARACAWALRSWWAPLVSDGVGHLHLMRAERAIRGAWLHGSISTGGEASVYLNT
jgi:hypothetical protein